MHVIVRMFAQLERMPPESGVSHSDAELAVVRLQL